MSAGQEEADLWGGLADPAAGHSWESGTVSVIFSATKGVAAILAWLLAQGGVLDFDAPVTEFWPEFGGGGKSAVPVRYLFTHQVGLPYLGDGTSMVSVAWLAVLIARPETSGTLSVSQLPRTCCQRRGRIGAGAFPSAFISPEPILHGEPDPAARRLHLRL